MIIIHYCPFDINSNVTVTRDGKYLHESISSNMEDFPKEVYQLTQDHHDNMVKLYGPRDILQETLTYMNKNYSNNNIQIEVIEA